MVGENTLIVVNPAELADLMFEAGEVPVPRACFCASCRPWWKTRTRRPRCCGPRGLHHQGGGRARPADHGARQEPDRRRPDADPQDRVPGLARADPGRPRAGLLRPEPPRRPNGPRWRRPSSSAAPTAADPARAPVRRAPGSGRPRAAKWLAAQFGVPLYRVDIGGTKNMYVGEVRTGCSPTSPGSTTRSPAWPC